MTIPQCQISEIDHSFILIFYFQKLDIEEQIKWKVIKKKEKKKTVKKKTTDRISKIRAAPEGSTAREPLTVPWAEGSDVPASSPACSFLFIGCKHQIVHSSSLDTSLSILSGFNWPVQPGP